MKIPFDRSTNRLLLLIGLALSACGGQMSDESMAEAKARVEACLAKVPVLSQGPHGCATSAPDIGRSEDVIEGLEIKIYALTSREPTSADSPLAITRTNGAGNFEIPLAVGSYWMCGPEERVKCAVVDVEPGKTSKWHIETLARVP